MFLRSVNRNDTYVCLLGERTGMGGSNGEELGRRYNRMNTGRPFEG